MSTDRSMDSDEDKIVEDVPRMRSVSMMASPSAMIREAPYLVKEYGSVPLSPFAPKSAPAVKTAPVEVPSLPSSWTNPTLESIPLYYRLERTHATVRAEPAVVAQRLSDCFRGQSMGTVYHDNEVGAFDRAIREERPWLPPLLRAEGEPRLNEVCRFLGELDIFFVAERSYANLTASFFSIGLCQRRNLR